jgi:hypothetical protein
MAKAGSGCGKREGIAFEGFVHQGDDEGRGKRVAPAYPVYN